MTCLYGVLDTESGPVSLRECGPRPSLREDRRRRRRAARPRHAARPHAGDVLRGEGGRRCSPGTASCCTPTGSSRPTTPSARCSALPRLKETMARAPGGAGADRPRALRPRGLHRSRRRAGGRHHDGDPAALRRRRPGGPPSPTDGCWPSSSCRASRATSARRSRASSDAVAGLGSGAGPSRAPQDRGGRGDDERDGARQRVPRRPPGVDPRDPHPGAVERASSPTAADAGRAADAGETGPRGEARRPPEAARLGPAPDREDGRRDARDERGGHTHPSSSRLRLEGGGHDDK